MDYAFQVTKQWTTCFENSLSPAMTNQTPQHLFHLYQVFTLFGQLFSNWLCSIQGALLCALSLTVQQSQKQA